MVATSWRKKHNLLDTSAGMEDIDHHADATAESAEVEDDAAAAAAAEDENDVIAETVGAYSHNPLASVVESVLSREMLESFCACPFERAYPSRFRGRAPHKDISQFQTC